MRIFQFVLAVFCSGFLHAQTTPTIPPSPTLGDGAPTTLPTERTQIGHMALDVFVGAGLKESGLSYDLFKKVFVGYCNIKDPFKIDKTVITIIDFDRPSIEKRMWIVDLSKKTLLQHCLVAHGKQTGENMALKFSNDAHSSASSLGFYIVRGTYLGKNGLSLRLDGIDKGYNDNAMKRAVVMHGANYVSEKFIKTYGRLGRSWGCPAVPADLIKGIVDQIAHGSILFINKSGVGYGSKYLDEESAEANAIKGI